MDFVLGPSNRLDFAQEMSPFNGMFTLFIIVFIVIFVIVVLTFALNFWRAIKYRGTENQGADQPTPPPEATKEIIREIVKIRCPYCGNLYDETEDKCPTCGAKR
jgi:heme/copper-type cytochrome/quinol oxidase subunit 2